MPSISFMELPPYVEEASKINILILLFVNLFASYAAVNPDNPAPTIIKS